MDSTGPTSLEPLFSVLVHSLSKAERTFYSLPGSHVIERYVRSSHQNDPGRTFLELLLVVLVVRTLLQSRTRTDRSAKNFIEFNDKEIEELVDEWIPEPLTQDLNPIEEADLASVPVITGPYGPRPTLANGKTVWNLASFNWTGLAGNEYIKQRAIEAMRKYGTGTCGPSGFYGHLDVHIDVERELIDFLGAEDAIFYPQGYTTTVCVIPAFCKRGDIIIADRGVSFAIQKGMQASRSTIRWYDHNDLQSLEDVLISVDKETKRKKGPLTRRFIVTEGIFERNGALVDLPKLVELKTKYKYRLILDETFSFGIVGRTGRGLTELYNVKADKIDLLIGSAATSLCAGGGFCTGSKAAIYHQRINAAGYVYTASTPALLTVGAIEGINVLRENPSILAALQDNVRAARAILDKMDCIAIPSHPASPMIHIQLKSPAASSLHPSEAIALSAKPSNPASPLPRDAASWTWDIAAEEKLLQDVVEEALAQGVMITRAKRLRGQEINEPRPSIRLALTSAMSRKETENAVNVVKAALVKIVGRRK